MHRRFNGWIRAAIVFTVFWVVILSALAIYEHAATGPWDYFGHNHGLLFHTWAKNPMYNKTPIEGFNDLYVTFHAGDSGSGLYFPLSSYGYSAQRSFRRFAGCARGSAPSAMRWSEPPAAVLFTFQMTKPLSIFTTLALGGRRPSCSR